MYMGGGVKKKIENMKKERKKGPIQPFLAHPTGGQETTFYLRVASLFALIINHYNNMYLCCSSLSSLRSSS